MESLVSRLRTALETLKPGLSSCLRPGLDEAGLASLETSLGVRLPDDVREFYTLVDGQLPDGPGLWDGTELLNSDRIVKEWTIWKNLLDGGEFEESRCEPAAGIKDDWWSAKWIPLTYNGSGDHHSLDLDPAAGGRHGQIIMMWHDDPTRPLLARSFRAWLEEYCDGLERGDYVYSEEEYFAVVNKEDVS